MSGITILALVGCVAAGTSGAPPRVALELEQGGRSFGTLVFELDAQKAPLTTENFLKYADDGYYDGTLIHRITVGPRIHVFQGGGYTALNTTTKPGQRPPIRNEADNGLKNVRGTIAMARDRDPHSATAEYFVNIQDNPKLDYVGPEHWGYCVFGRLVEGLDVLDRLAALETRVNPDPELNGEKSQPLDPPIVKKVRRMRD